MRSWISNHPTLIFWIRMVIWIIVGCVVPITVFAVKFGLFTDNSPVVDELGNTVSSPDISLNGWGIIACLLIGSYVSYILQEVADANVGYSLIKQCYMGFSKLIPLIVTLLVFHFLSGVISQVIYCLTVLIICRAVAVPINPLPKWKFDKLGVEEYSDALKFLTDFVKNFKKGSGV